MQTQTFLVSHAETQGHKVFVTSLLGGHTEEYYCSNGWQADIGIQKDKPPCHVSIASWIIKALGIVFLENEKGCPKKRNSLHLSWRQFTRTFYCFCRYSQCSGCSSIKGASRANIKSNISYRGEKKPRLGLHCFSPNERNYLIKFTVFSLLL